MEHLDLAAEALQAFSAYAKKMEQLPEVHDVLALRIFSDGSGSICAGGNYRHWYIEFDTLANLLQQLKQRERRAGLAEITHIAEDEGLYD